MTQQDAYALALYWHNLNPNGRIVLYMKNATEWTWCYIVPDEPASNHATCNH